MEHGFYHDSRGYWQTISDPDVETLATYPEGTTEVPLKPGADYEWRDGEWAYIPPPPVIPESLTRIQFKGALLLAGLLDQVEALIITLDPLTQLKWREATEFPRADPMIDMLGAQIGLEPADIDAMYIGATEI